MKACGGGLNPRQRIPPIGGGLGPDDWSKERNSQQILAIMGKPSLLPVACSLFPLPKGVELSPN
jgi:hypothetical protein